MWLKKVRSLLGEVDRERVRVLAQAKLGPDERVTVTEIACREPGCPPVETMLMIFSDTQATRSISIPKPVGKVKDDDIREALRRAKPQTDMDSPHRESSHR